MLQELPPNSFTPTIDYSNSPLFTISPQLSKQLTYQTTAYLKDIVKILDSLTLKYNLTNSAQSQSDHYTERPVLSFSRVDLKTAVFTKVPLLCRVS